MSRPYIIRIAETVRRHVVVEDGVEARLDVLDVLAHDETSALLEEELERRGFTVEDGVAHRTEADGIRISIHIESRKVHVGKREEREVELTIDRTIRSSKAEADEPMIQAVRNEADQKIERDREAERRAMSALIEQRLGDLRAELDDAVVKVTQAALKKRASQIGEIESIEEDESGSMTIRIRV